MRRSHIIFSCVHLLSSLLAIIAGALCITLRFSDHLQILLTRHNSLLLKLGIILIVTGFALIMTLFLLNRRRYYEVKMATGRASIDEKLLRSFLIKYWQERYPEQTHPDVIVRAKKRLEILAELPKIDDPDEKEALLRNLEEDLGDRLFQNFSYQGEFFLTISS
ncbi:MAG: hypothetical protein SNF33_05775 [Candidatus Algichlamydia australiensis]|nr:hypothetical protein [Chlamydiales bacterium]